MKPEDDWQPVPWREAYKFCLFIAAAAVFDASVVIAFILKFFS